MLDAHRQVRERRRGLGGDQPLVLHAREPDTPKDELEVELRGRVLAEGLGDALRPLVVDVAVREDRQADRALEVQGEERVGVADEPRETARPCPPFLLRPAVLRTYGSEEEEEVGLVARVPVAPVFWVLVSVSDEMQGAVQVWEQLEEGREMRGVSEMVQCERPHGVELRERGRGIRKTALRNAYN